MSGIKLYASILAIPAILLVLCLLWGVLERERLHQYDHIIQMASERYDIPEPLIRAVIWRESRFHADAIGQAGERGLMQVMEPAGREWADHEKLDRFESEDLLQPRINILAGSWYLSRPAAAGKKPINPTSSASPNTMRAGSMPAVGPKTSIT
jgi:soluble lytic murein transglycosylase